MVEGVSGVLRKWVACKGWREFQRDNHEMNLKDARESCRLNKGQREARPGRGNRMGVWGTPWRREKKREIKNSSSLKMQWIKKLSHLEGRIWVHAGLYMLGWHVRLTSNSSRLLYAGLCVRIFTLRLHGMSTSTWGGCYYYYLFTNKGIEARRG